MRINRTARIPVLPVRVGPHHAQARTAPLAANGAGLRSYRTGSGGAARPVGQRDRRAARAAPSMDKPDEAPPQGLALSGAPRAPPPPSPLPSPTSLSNSVTGASIANALGLSLSNLLPNAPVAASGGASALFSASGGNGASLGTLLESFVAGSTRSSPANCVSYSHVTDQDLPAASASFWEALGSINPNLALTGGLPSPTSLPQLNAGMSLDQLSQVTKQALSSMLPQHAFVPPAPTAKRKKQGEWDSLDASGALSADQQQLKRTALGSSGAALEVPIAHSHRWQGESRQQRRSQQLDRRHGEGACAVPTFRS